MKKQILIYTLIIVSLQIACSQENKPPILGQEKNYSYEVVVDGIFVPWGMAFINSEELLVTEQSGILYHVKNGIKKEVDGLPNVYFRGQGGLLDVALHPDFKLNKTIFLCYYQNKLIGTASLIIEKKIIHNFYKWDIKKRIQN